MAKLTYAQECMLKNLIDPDHYGRTSGPTNSTLCALLKRGLVKRVRATGKDAPCYLFVWVITDAGRAAVTPAGNAGKPLGLCDDGICDDHGVFGCKRCVTALEASALTVNDRGTS